MSRDGRTVFVSSHGRQLAARAPTVADTMHHGMHAGEGATRATGTLVLLDARTGALRQVIPVGRFATALGLGGAGRP